MGIAKDGLPVYTPYFNNGETYAGTDVDVCNGLTINGVYAYVSTLFHPYFIGCYGKGSSPSVGQQCSTNPRIQGAVQLMGAAAAAITALASVF